MYYQMEDLYRQLNMIPAIAYSPSLLKKNGSLWSYTCALLAGNLALSQLDSSHAKPK